MRTGHSYIPCQPWGGTESWPQGLNPQQNLKANYFALKKINLTNRVAVGVGLARFKEDHYR